MKKKILLLGAIVLAFGALVFIANPQTAFAEEVDECIGGGPCGKLGEIYVGDWNTTTGKVCCFVKGHGHWGIEDPPPEEF